MECFPIVKSVPLYENDHILGKERTDIYIKLMLMFMYSNSIWNLPCSCVIVIEVRCNFFGETSIISQETLRSNKMLVGLMIHALQNFFLFETDLSTKEDKRPNIFQ